MAASETWFDGVARVAATIEGLAGAIAFAAGTGGQGATVKPMPDSLPETPACVLFYRGAEVTPGSWERIRHTVEGRIVIARPDLGIAYGELMKYPARVMTAFRPRAQAFGSLASCLVTGFSSVEDIQWPSESGRWYLALPFTIEAVENTATGYTAA